MLVSYRFDHMLYNFTSGNATDYDEENRFTVIVGKNGTGKSRLLRAVVRHFLGSRAESHGFIKDERHKDRQLLNGSLSLAFNPEKVIAVSTSPFDKFPVLMRGEEVEGYSYLGLRGLHSHNLGLAYMAKIISALISSILFDPGKANTIGDVLGYLGYNDVIESKFQLSISTAQIKGILNSNNSEEELTRFVNNSNPNRFDRSFYVGNDGVLSLDKVKRTLFIFDKLKNTALKPRFDILIGPFGVRAANSLYDIDDDFIFLLQSGFLRLREIALEKAHHGARFKISDASSGEQSVVMGLLGIASKIEDGSLICIDEPEICLHPEWQEKYIQLLISTFQGYRRCHFLIATHSPQIISKLNQKNCFVMTMETGESTDAGKFINQSVDFQLAKVFKSPGFKNEYLSRVALNIFVKVGRNKKFDQEDIDSLSLLEGVFDSLEKDDPVYGLILALREMLQSYA